MDLVLVGVGAVLQEQAGNVQPGIFDGQEEQAVRALAAVQGLPEVLLVLASHLPTTVKGTTG